MTIEEAQKEAQKRGHCLCNLKRKCPCEVWKEYKLCPCASLKGYEKN